MLAYPSSKNLFMYIICLKESEQTQEIIWIAINVA